MDSPDLPQVIRVVAEKRPKDAKKIVPPTKCPVCGGEVAKDEGGVYIRCINPSCEAQLKERLRYFCGRDQMNIKGLGDVWIDRLVDEKIVTSLASLYDLERREEELACLVVEGEFGEEAADALLAAIKSTRSQELKALEQAASKCEKAPEKALIPLTKATVRKLAVCFPTLESFISAPRKQIEAALRDAPEDAQRVWEFLSPCNREDTVKGVCALIQKKVLPLKGIGTTTVERLVTAGMVERPADLFNLHRRRSELASLKLPRTFGPKNAQAVIISLNASKKQPLARVLAALNIRHVGGSTAEILAERFKSMEAIADAAKALPVADAESGGSSTDSRRTQKKLRSGRKLEVVQPTLFDSTPTVSDQLQEVDGIGPEVARSIRQFFSSAAGRNAWQSLRDAGVKMEPPKPAPSGKQPLAGKTIVVTGTLQCLSRSQIEGLIKERGGKVASSVSSKTTFVLAGEDPGKKLDKARSLGVLVVDEQEFMRLAGEPIKGKQD